MYGKGWKKIASLIKTRTVVQIRTHAQKYFLKLTKARQSGDANMSTDGKASGTGGRKVGCINEQLLKTSSGTSAAAAMRYRLYSKA